VLARIAIVTIAIACAAAAPALAQDPAPRDTALVLPDDHPDRPQEPPRTDLSAAERVTGAIGRLLQKPFEMAGTALEGTLIPIEEERGGFATGLAAAATPRERSHLSYSGGSIGTRSGFVGAGIKYDAFPQEEGPQLGATIAGTNRGYRLITAFGGWNDPAKHPYARVTGYYDVDAMDQFWGLGIDSEDDDQTVFSWEKRGAVAIAGLPERRGIWGRAYLTYERSSVFDGYQPDEPDLDEIFPEHDFPALTLWGPGATVALDFRDQTGYPKSGFLLQGKGEMWRSTDEDDVQWIRYGAEASGHVPLGSDWHILSAKAGFDVAEPDEEDGFIPFVYLPTLGGSQILRGYSGWRFRDLAAAYATAELRWRLWLEHTRDPDQAGALEAALFYDVGTVGPELGDLDFGDRQSSYGVLGRIYLLSGHLMTFGVGLGGDAPRFVFTTSNSW